MLRLQESQITLTQKDIDNYKRRSEGKPVARLIDLPQSVETSPRQDFGQAWDVPILRQGAQRSRDEAVVHTPNVSFVETPVVGSVVEVSCKTEGPSHLDPLAEKHPQRVRRDSLLSNEESQYSDDTYMPASPDSPRSATSGLTPSPPARRNAVHGRRNSAAGQDTARHTATTSRRYRPRSFSDPCEAPVLSYKPRRCPPSSPIRPAAAHLSMSGGLSSVPEHAKVVEPENLSEVPPRSSTLRARHHSLPGYHLLPNGVGRPSCDDDAALQTESSIIDGSLPLSTLHTMSSPLEALGRQLAEMSTIEWTADLPVRQRTTGDIEISNVADTLPVLSEGEAYLQSPSPSRTISDDELSRPNDTFNNRVISRRKNTCPETTAPLDLAVGRGGRPRVGTLSRPVSGPMRRRAVSDAEQENNESMQRFNRERELHQARAQEGVGGLVETTPPPLGRLERMLY